MSLQLLQSTVPQTSQSIKCYDAVVRGNLTVTDGSASFHSLGINGTGSATLPGKIAVGNMPAPYTQATSRTTTVTTDNDFVFMVNTDNTSLAAHTSVIFKIENTQVQPNSHIILTCQTPVNGLIYSVCEVASDYLQVQCSNVSAGAITTSSRIAVRVLDASAPA